MKTGASGMVFGALLLLLFIALIALSACTGGAANSDGAPSSSSSSSGSSSSTSSTSGGPSTATPQVIFDGRFEQAADGGACADVGTLMPIGSFGDGASTPASSVKDNGQAEGEMVRVSCSVKRSAAAADAFDVQGTIAHSKTGFVVSGVFRPSGEQTGIKVRITTRGKELDQVDDQCVARYTTPIQGVAAGRVWAEVDCPSVIEAGGNGASICRAIAQVRFENCAQ